MTPEEKFRQKEFFLKESPDKIGDSIKEKIRQAELDEWQVQPILKLIRKEKINNAIGRLSELIDFTDKEKAHFKDVPVDVILKWLGVKEEKEGISEE